MSLLFSKTGSLTRWNVTRREMGLWSKVVDNIENQRKKLKKQKLEELKIEERNVWREYQIEQTKFQERKKASLEMARWQEQEEQRLRQEAHDAAVRAELEKKMKSSGTAEDKLDEEYFKDYSRFDKRKDERDPLFANDKNRGGESEDFQSMLRDGIRESKETFQQMKESQPFTYTGATSQGGRFGFQTVEVGTGLVVSILLLFVVMAYFELKAVYDENLIEKQALNSAAKINK